MTWKPGTKLEVLAWRQPMEDRGGSGHLPGVGKVTCLALLVAFTHDLLRWITLTG